MNGSPPTLGIGVLFFVLCALAMPLIELWHTLHGRSSAARWRFVGQQVLVALGILAVVVVGLWALQHYTDLAIDSHTGLMVALVVALVPPAFVALILAGAGLALIGRSITRRAL